MKKDKKLRLPLILAAGVFLVAGVDALQHGAPLVGTVDLAAAFVNLAAIGFVKRSPLLTSIIVNLMNAIVAGVMTLAAIQAGKQYIQYAWVVVLLFFLGSVVILLRKPRARRTTEES